MKKHIHNVISRLAGAEKMFLQTRFLAPVVRAAEVRVRIANVICRMRISPRSFSGWGVFRPTSYTHANFERDATMVERQRYLALFPAVRLILTDRSDAGWLAAPARLADARFQLDGQVPVVGVDDAEMFDTIIARFDGATFWVDEPDPQAEPAVAAYLRESLVRMLDPRFIDRAGLTPEQRLAYAAVHAERLRRELESQRATGEYRLRLAIEHAGAKLRGFAELPDVYRVTYSVDGRNHVSVVRKNDLSVQSAGVCLSGQDAYFDLASLVGVLREGQRSRGGIHHGLQV